MDNEMTGAKKTYQSSRLKDIGQWSVLFALIPVLVGTLELYIYIYSDKDFSLFSQILTSVDIISFLILSTYAVYPLVVLIPLGFYPKIKENLLSFDSNRSQRTITICTSIFILFLLTVPYFYLIIMFLIILFVELAMFPLIAKIYVRSTEKKTVSWSVIVKANWSKISLKSDTNETSAFIDVAEKSATSLLTIMIGAFAMVYITHASPFALGTYNLTYLDGKESKHIVGSILNEEWGTAKILTFDKQILIVDSHNIKFRQACSFDTKNYLWNSASNLSPCVP